VRVLPVIRRSSGMFWCRSVAKLPGLERVLGGGRPNIRLEPGMFTSIINEFNSGVLALIGFSLRRHAGPNWSLQSADGGLDTQL
jgi:hypothetical protein